jgi:hypothetical protein
MNEIVISEIVLRLVGVAAKLLLIAAGVFYASLVVATYAKEGPGFQLRLELGDPVRFGQRLLIWMGVRMTAILASAFRWILELLYEASADVGAWVVSKSNPQVQARVSSRFL